MCDLHASEHETELVRLVVGSNVVQVKYSDLEHTVVCTEAEVGDSQNGGQLKAEYCWLKSREPENLMHSIQLYIG